MALIDDVAWVGNALDEVEEEEEDPS